MSLALTAYKMLSSVAFSFIKGRECRKNPAAFAERSAIYSGEKLARLTADKRFWLHAVSVGEVQAASPLISEIKKMGWGGDIIVSTVTATGAANADRLFGDKVGAHIYAPFDLPNYVAPACDALRPTAYATIETEVWPNLLSELKGRGVPTFLVNARISDRTLARADRFRGALGEAYNMFSRIYARSDEDACRLLRIGVADDRVQVTGDCKIDAIIEQRERLRGELPDLRRRLGLRGETPLIVAGSTHPGEDEIVLEAFRRLRSGSGAATGARLILAPRHPERAVSLLEKTGQVAGSALLSDIGGESPEIVIVDEIGVLYSLYGLADAAFIGGSLVRRGGQNIMEPASWGVPVLHGPYMDDFAQATSELDGARAAYAVENAVQMADIWEGLLSGRIAGSTAGAPLFEKRAGASAAVWHELEKYLT